MKFNQLSMVKAIMVFSGLWRFPFKTENKILNPLYTCYSIIAQTGHTLMVISMILEFPNVLKISMVLVNESVCVIFICCIYSGKMFLCQSSKILKLIKTILDEEKRIRKEEDEGAKAIFEKNVKYIINLNLYIMCISFLVTSTLLVTKYISYLQVDLSDNTTEFVYHRKPLPYITWFPFDTDEYYQWAFLCQSFLAVYGVSYNSATYMCLINIMNFVVVKLKILRYKFELYKEVSGEDNLKRLIEEHYTVINYVGELNAAIKYVALSDFVLNSFQMATSTYQLLTYKFSLISIPFSFFWTLMVSQNFLLAWHADAIQEESFGIRTSIYFCEWYNCSIKIQKVLLFMMTRCHKPLNLSVGPFFPMTNDIFAKTVKATYSFVTLFQQRSGKKKD